jgi:DNA-binding LacI/PurR family transcriptional regulator
MMKKDFLYKTISNQIKTWIEQGRFESTNQLPTTTELAKEFATSPMTINKALELLVNNGFVTRLAGKGTFVKKRSQIQIIEPKIKHGIIGAIVYDTSHHDLWSRALRGIEDALQINGYNLIIGNDDGNFMKASKYISNFANLKIDGLIFVPIGCSSKEEYETKNLKLIKQIEQSGIPYVLFHRLINTYNTAAVTLDDYNTAYQLIMKFLKRKIKKPICLSHYFTSSTAFREQGFIDALTDFGFSNPRQNVFRIHPSGQTVDSKVSDQIIKILQENNDIDGIFAVENDILSVALNAIKDNTDFDSNKVQFSCFDYSGTIDSDDVKDIMDVPIYEMGAFAGEMILHKINSDKYIDHKIQFFSSFRSRE